MSDIPKPDIELDICRFWTLCYFVFIFTNSILPKLPVDFSYLDIAEKQKRVREKIKVLTPLIKLRPRYCDVWIVKRLSVGYNQHSKIKLSVKRKILVGDNKIIKSAVFLEVNMCIRNKWTELGNLPGGGGGGGCFF